MSFQLIGVIDLGHHMLSPYLCDPNALPKPMMAYYQWHPREQIAMAFESKYTHYKHGKERSETM